MINRFSHTQKEGFMAFYKYRGKRIRASEQEACIPILRRFDPDSVHSGVEVYNHLSDRERIEHEIARLDNMAINF